MKMLVIELRKEKRSGITPVMLLTGVFGALYAYANFIVRKDSLLALSLPPMDILLTQLYGVISVLNLFGIIVAACMIYGIEFTGGAIKKMVTLPIRIGGIYLSKFIILTALLMAAVTVQNIALAQIGMTNLPAGAFDGKAVMVFAIYSFITSMPVLSFMLFISSLCENIWVTLGVGVAGFLSSMALATGQSAALMCHPFVMLLKPAMAMSSTPDNIAILFAVIATLLFSILGLAFTKYRRYE